MYPLIDIARTKIPHAVFYDKGYFLAGHIETIAIRFGIIENRACFIPVVKIIGSFLCYSGHKTYKFDSVTIFSDGYLCRYIIRTNVPGSENLCFIQSKNVPITRYSNRMVWNSPVYQRFDVNYFTIWVCVHSISLI